MKKRFFTLITFALVLALFFCLAACNKDSEDDDTDAKTTAAATDDSTEATTETPTEETTEQLTETETETETTTEEPTTVDLTSRNNVLEDPAHVTFYNSQKSPIKSTFSGENQCTFRITRDSSFGTILTLQTTKNASDPFVTFNYGSYVKAHGLTPVSANEYKYIVITIKAVNCTSETFELFYCAGNITGPTAGYQKTATFNSSLDGWQKLVFDLSKVDFSGAVNAFRLDFLTAPGSKPETVHIASIDFYKTSEEAFGSLDIDTSRPGDDYEYEEHKFDGVNYDKVTASDEDPNLLLWFDHMTEKVPQHIVNPTDRNTYVINMAGNSIENCQLFLAPTVADTSVNISISDFTGPNGNTLKTQILRENYVNINGVYYPDALPKIDGAITIKQGKSQGFVIKAWADMDEPAGLYSAVVTVKDSSGKTIKTANVYVNVLDFSLSEETTLKSAIGLSSWNIGLSYQNAGLLNYSGEELYKIYYDFLLENRLAAYQLPYSLYDNRCIEYLNNPRVTSFVINKVDGNNIGAAHDVLKDNPVWMDKGFFYYVDEPCESGKLGEIQSWGNRLEGAFPGYNQISPFFTNIDCGNDQDQVEFMSPYINIWCTKMFAFTPRDKYMMSGVQYMTTRAQDEKYGTFAERVAEFQKNGEEMWLYICWEPEQPYTNWLIMGDGTETIVSIWQCKMTNADGILYWDASYWNQNDIMGNVTPLIGATSHGDGILLYSGAQVGSYEPVSSLRLESIRQGMQDHMMLSMLDEATCNEFIAMVTEDVITYTNDDDYLNHVRQLLAFAVAEKN